MLFDRNKRPAELQRIDDDAGAETRSWVKIADIQAWIYARSDSEIALHDGNFSKSYSGEVAKDTDVKIGDRIIFDGVTYGVSGVRIHGFGNVASRRLLLEEASDQNE